MDELISNLPEDIAQQRSKWKKRIHLADPNTGFDDDNDNDY